MRAIRMSGLMPGGMNGVKLAREIRRRNPRLAVMLSTAYPVSAREAEAEAEGIPVLLKPYSIETLSNVLRRRLH